MNNEILKLDRHVTKLNNLNNRLSKKGKLISKFVIDTINNHYDVRDRQIANKASSIFKGKLGEFYFRDMLVSQNAFDQVTNVNLFNKVDDGADIEATYVDSNFKEETFRFQVKCSRNYYSINNLKSGDYLTFRPFFYENLDSKEELSKWDARVEKNNVDYLVIVDLENYTFGLNGFFITPASGFRKSYITKGGLYKSMESVMNKKEFIQDLKENDYA